MLNKFRLFIPKSNFWKDVFTLTFGTGLAQVIPILISPILTNFYSPEDFGNYGLYFSCTMVLSVLICGRYEMAILLPEDDRERANILALCLIIALIITTLLFVVSGIWGHEISLLFKNDFLSKFIYYIPVSVLFIGLLQGLNFWFNQKKQYKHLSVSRVNRSLTTSGFGLFFGVFNFKNFGLIISDLLGQLFSIIYLLFIKKTFVSSISKLVSLKDIKEAALRYKDFPKYYVISGLFEKASSHAPVILLTLYFSSVEAGFFALALRVISSPVSLISGSIGDVFRQQVSEVYYKEGNCVKIFNNTLKKLILIGLPLFLIGFLLIKFLFSYIFGAEWEMAGVYSQIMCVMFFLQFVISPLSSMIIIAEKQKIGMMTNIILFSFSYFSFWIAKSFFDSATMAIVFYVVIYSLKYIVEFLLSFKYSMGYANKQRKL